MTVTGRENAAESTTTIAGTTTTSAIMTAIVRMNTIAIETMIGTIIGATETITTAK